MSSNKDEMIKGTCILMCPTNERILRIREKLVHPLECKVNVKGKRTKYADHQRMVKEFNRSAAGHNIPASAVRPLPVLEKTVNYLLSDVCLCKDGDWIDRYEFTADRLRAVRQDITVQNLSGIPVAKLLYRVARFYVFAAYNMCEYDTSKFDPYLNTRHLNEVLSIIINIYKESSFNPDETIIDNCYQNYPNKTFDEEAMTSLEDMMANVDLDAFCNDSLPSDDLDMQFNHSVLIDDSKHSRMEEIISMNLLVNVGRYDVIRDALEVPKRIRKGDLLSRVIYACLCWLHGNFMPMTRLASNIPTILCCALHSNLNRIQRQALGVFSVSHNKTTFIDESENFRKNLLFSSPEKLIQTCLYYGLNSSNDGIEFTKASFNWDTNIMKPEKCDWLKLKLSECSLPSLLLH